MNYADYSLARYLAARGFAVWTFDVAGYGESQEVEDGFMPNSDYAAEDAAAAAAEILKVSGQKKLDVLLELLKLTKEQGAILKEKEPDMDRFDEIIQEKAKLLDNMETLDRGFDALFAKAGDTLKNNKYEYQTQITEMQNLIRSITDTGVQIEGQEHRATHPSFHAYRY